MPSSKAFPCIRLAAPVPAAARPSVPVLRPQTRAHCASCSCCGPWPPLLRAMLLEKARFLLPAVLSPFPHAPYLAHSERAPSKVQGTARSGPRAGCCLGSRFALRVSLSPCRLATDHPSCWSRGVRVCIPELEQPSFHGCSGHSGPCGRSDRPFPRGSVSPNLLKLPPLCRTPDSVHWPDPQEPPDDSLCLSKLELTCALPVAGLALSRTLVASWERVRHGCLHRSLNSLLSSPLFLLFPLCCFFLHIIFRLVSFRPGNAAPPLTAPGWYGPGVPIHPQAAAAPPSGAHAVGATATERAGAAAPGDPAAAPAVPGEAQAAVPAAAAALEQGGSAPGLHLKQPGAGAAAPAGTWAGTCWEQLTQPQGRAQAFPRPRLQARSRRPGANARAGHAVSCFPGLPKTTRQVGIQTSHCRSPQLHSGAAPKHPPKPLAHCHGCLGQASPRRSLCSRSLLSHQSTSRGGGRNLCC